MGVPHFRMRLMNCHPGLFEGLFTIFTNPVYHYLYLRGLITAGEFYIRHIHFLEADGAATLPADKMNMVIVVMPFGTFFFTKGVTNRIIGRRDDMNDTFINKSLQCSVHSYPIYLFAGPFFNIAMRQCPALREKQFQYP